MADSSFSAVLRDKNFFRLWLGQIISSVGDRFYQFALLSVVLDIHQGLGVGKESARVAFCGMLPGFIFAPWLGWAVDRFSRRHLMIFSDLARAVLTLSFIYFWFHLHSLVWVFAIIFMMGALNGLFIPARQSALPQLVDTQRLVTANALIALVGVIASLVGGIFAGLLVSIFGARISFILNAVGFIASGWLIYRITKPLRPERNGENDALERNWLELSAGWRLLRSRAELGGLVLLNSLFAFTSGVFLITVLEHTVTAVDLSLANELAAWLTIIFSKFAPKPPVFDIKVLSLGLLLACVGVGLSLGVAFCGKLRRWPHWKGLPYLSLLLLGVGMIGFSRLTDYGSALIGCICLGFLGSLIAIPIESRLQHEVSNQLRGRVFALRNLCTTTSFLIALGLNLSGTLLAQRGATQMIADLGMGVTAMALILSAWNRAQLRTFWAVPTPAT
jgi:MFS family permease